MDSKRSLVHFSWVILAMGFLIVCCSCGEKPKTPPEKESGAAFEFTSPAFVNGGLLPAKYTCEGENVSPPLRWNGIPQDTQSLALISEDPDAPDGSRVLWIVHSIPPSIVELPEGVPVVGILPNGAKQGMNDSKDLGYRGPCPPAGATHRCTFKLNALDNAPKLPPGISKKDLINAMQGHRLAERQLMGTCERK